MKRGGKMKTSTKVLLGAGGAAAVGGIGYFFWSRAKEAKDLAAEQQLAEATEVDESEAGSKTVDRMPLRRGDSSAAKLHRDSMSRSAPGGSPVMVSIVVKQPKARLHIDEEKYVSHPGSRLLDFFGDGDVVDYKTALGIIRWQCTGKGTPTQMDISGTNIAVQSPLIPDSIFYKKVTSGDTAVDGLLAGSPMSAGVVDFKKLGFAEAFLSPHIPLVKGSQDAWMSTPRVAQLSLPPGSYTVIARMRRLEGLKVEPWMYLKGYWHWTKNGPRTKSCGTQKRYLVERNCPNHIAAFGRAMYYATWDDVAFIVKVGTTPTEVEIRPMFDISIGEITYFRNEYSNKIGKYCRILNDYTGDTLRRWIANVASWCGC